MYEVTFTVTPPIQATDDQLREWISFCIGCTASISIDNPLSEYDLSDTDLVSIN